MCLGGSPRLGHQCLGEVVVRCRLQLKVQSKSVVELGHEVGGGASDRLADSLNRDRADLLGLGFRIHADADVVCRQQHLEWEDAGDAAGDWHDRDHPSSEADGRDVDAIVTDDDGGPTFVGLSCEVRDPDRPGGSHRAASVKPSAAVASHQRASSEDSHSDQASAWASSNTRSGNCRMACWIAADRLFRPAACAKRSNAATSLSERVMVNFT